MAEDALIAFRKGTDGKTGGKFSQVPSRIFIRTFTLSGQRAAAAVRACHGRRTPRMATVARAFDGRRTLGVTPYRRQSSGVAIKAKGTYHLTLLAGNRNCALGINIF